MPALLSTLVLLALGCSAPTGPDGVRVRRFRTTRCKEPAALTEQAPPLGEWGYTRWHPPVSSPVRLWELPGEVQGGPPEVQEAVRSWDAAALASTWKHTTEEGEARWLSEELSVGREGAKVRLRIRPGRARQLALVTSHKREVDRRVRGLRTTTFTLDQGAPDRLLTLEADLDVLLRENWGDERHSPSRLRRLEVSLPVTQAEGFSLEEVTILSRDASLAQAAGRTLAEVDGRLHPAWYVRPQRAVELRVRVPEGGAELRWMGATTQGKGAARVRLIPAEGEPVRLASTREEHAWAHRSASLDPWAGQEVRISLESAGPRVQLFGDARILVPGTRQAHVPSVIVYLVDTLRADHLGAWGNPDDGVSPRIDEVVGESVMFANTISSSCWTKPAIPTVLTGLWATTHGVGAHSYSDTLPEAAPTVQDALRVGGWRTGSFSANPLGSTLSGLEQGFDMALPPHHWRGRMPPLGHPSASQLTEAFLDWQAEEPDQPFFAYIHTVEPHAWRRALYEDPPDGLTSYEYAVQDADRQFGAFVDELRARGLDRDLLLVFVADHGESFGDHGVKAHGTGLWQSQVHIPFFLWAPGNLPPMRSSLLVGLADLTPTVVDLVGLEPIPGVDGRSLIPALEGQPIHDRVPSDRVRYVWKPDDPKMHALVREDGLKLIRIGEEEQLFDLSKTPCEGQTAGVRARDLVDTLDAHLEEEATAAEAFQRAYGGGADAPVDAAQVQMLREMGYLE